ncbi:MAG: hypothetical protein AAGJ08_09940 [Cyanobacteria bacterium P01_H01_bin.35]
MKANILQEIKILNSSPVISQLVPENKLKVVGGYYDLDMGKIYLIS